MEDTTRTIQDVALCDSLFDSIRFGTDRQTGRRAPRGKEETEQRADESCLFLSTSKAEAAAEVAGDQKWVVSDQNKRATSQNQHTLTHTAPNGQRHEMHTHTLLSCSVLSCIALPFHFTPITLSKHSSSSPALAKKPPLTTTAANDMKRSFPASTTAQISFRSRRAVRQQRLFRVRRDVSLTEENVP